MKDLTGLAYNKPVRVNRDVLWLLAVGTTAGLSLFFGALHQPAHPPVLKFAWAFGIYGVIPLIVVGFAGPGRKSLFGNLFLGMAGLAILVPVLLRSYVLSFKSLFAQDPRLFVAAVAVGVALTLLGLGFRRVDLRQWGIGLGDWRWWLKFFVIMLVLIVPLVVGAAWLFPKFRSYYPVYGPARLSLAGLFSYQAGMGFYMLAWEFFFRGFLLFGVAKKAGPHAAVVLQALPFMLMHRGKPEAEVASSFLGAVLLGYFCLRAKSFWPAFGLHWAMNLSMDLVGFFW